MERNQNRPQQDHRQQDHRLRRRQYQQHHTNSDKFDLGNQHRGAMRRSEDLYFGKLIVMAFLASAFMTFGVLISIFLADKIVNSGLQSLTAALGFSTGLLFIVLTKAYLFTEANIYLPDSFPRMSAIKRVGQYIKFWLIVFIVNAIGAIIFGYLIYLAENYASTFTNDLSTLLEAKMTIVGSSFWGTWSQLIISGILGNALLAVALIYAANQREIISKFVVLFLASLLIFSGNLQFAPLNMAYFAITLPLVKTANWFNFLVYNLIPIGIGNIIGALLFAALPIGYYAKKKRDR